MKHLIFAPYATDLDQLDTIKELHSSVFKKFGLEVIQVPFSPTEYHATVLEKILRSQTESWDYVTFFDIDSIPIAHDTIPRALEIVKDKNTIYGNAQASNVFDINPYKTPPFAAPSFLTFSYEIWQKSLGIINRNIFSPRVDYPNPDGNPTETDVAEVFTREHEKLGTSIKLAYPIYTMRYDLTWKYGGYFGYPKFQYGNGTIFESLTYHNFQIRFPDKQHHFIDYCNYLLDRL